jgi:hypothetical protein
VFTAVSTRSLRTIENVHFTLATALAIQQQRADLYLAYAVERAQQGRYDEAQLVALETVGHVMLEDARVHLLLGMLALQQNDQRLLQEVKTFLTTLWRKDELTYLAQMERTGTVDFTIFQTGDSA